MQQLSAVEIFLSFAKATEAKTLFAWVTYYKDLTET